MADKVKQEDIKEIYDYINRVVGSRDDDLVEIRRRLSRLEANANWDPSLTREVE